MENLLGISYGIPVMGPAGTPHPVKVVVLRFLSQLESLGWGSDLWTCPAAATGVEITQGLEKQMDKSHAEQIMMHK